MSYLTSEPAGSSATIVLIHGSAVSARYWTHQIRDLTMSLRVLAVDLPGHGASDPLPAHSVDAYADAVADLQHVLGTGSAFVMGHSLGGAVALALAARRPQAVRGLVLLSSCAKLGRTTHWSEPLLCCAPGPLRKILFFMIARKVLFAPGASSLAIGLAMAELGACRAETVLQDVQIARTMDLTEQARGLAVPALIMCGSRDTVTPPALSARLHALMARSRLVIVDGAGHMLLLERPDRVNRAVLDFIGAVDVRPSRPRARRLPPVPLRSLLRGLLDRARLSMRS